MIPKDIEKIRDQKALLIKNCPRVNGTVTDLYNEDFRRGFNIAWEVAEEYFKKETHGDE